uniref:Uncharacterized protein n=1 Tax=Oryza brachyantha TaxID=4533 RepID=J3L9G7_ORYBR
AGELASKTQRSKSTAAVVEHSYPVVPFAVAGPHHAVVPGATQGLEHSGILPVTTVERHHSVVPLAAGGLDHTILPVPAQWPPSHAVVPLTAGIHHSVLPVAAVEFHNPVLPHAASGPPHPVVPIAAVKLHHSTTPLTAAEHAYPVLPVAAGGLHAASSIHASSANLGRQTRRAVRAAAGLVRPQPLNPSVAFLRPPAAVGPARRAAAVRAPRLRVAAARASCGKPHHAAVPPTPLHPTIAVRAELPPTDDNTAAQLLAAVSRWQHPGRRWPPAVDAARREAPLPPGLRRVVRVAAAAGAAVQLAPPMAAGSSCAPASTTASIIPRSP